MKNSDLYNQPLISFEGLMLELKNLVSTATKKLPDSCCVDYSDEVKTIGLFVFRSKEDADRAREIVSQLGTMFQIPLEQYVSSQPTPQ